MAKPAGENKTPLVIALVFFVLATLGLGGFAYTLSDAAAQAKENEKKAAADAKTAADQATKEKEAKLIYKAGMGILTKDDRAELKGLRFKDDARRVHAEMLDQVKGRASTAIGDEAKKFVGQGGGLAVKEGDIFGWNWPAGGDLTDAPAGLVDVAVTSHSQRQLAERNYNEQVKGMAAAQKTMSDLSKALDDAKKQMDDRTGKIPEEVATKVKEAIAAFETYRAGLQKEFATQREDRGKFAAQADAAELAKNAALVKASRVTEQNKSMAAEIDAKLDPFQFDQPQGKVIRRTGQTVEIDIGSAANLRTGLTFSIMPADTVTVGFQPRMRDVRDGAGRPVRRIVPKGGIEVVEILGANLASCRITGEESEVRDRILAGDLLYNPVWRKGQSEHIVLFGIFDLDGDGKDDIVTLARDLRRMGVKVDAYWDLTKNKWEGEITSQTTLAVEGYAPSVGVADGNASAKVKVISALTEARKQANDKGIRVLRPRDFFPRIGYKAKLDVTDDLINQAATFYGRSSSAGDETPDAPKPAGK